MSERTHSFCKSATQDELIYFLNTTSKSLVRQYKIKRKSSEKELNTKCSNKKQFDSLYAKSFNDHRLYNSYLEDLKIAISYLL
jgi:hypothetical protein